MTPCNVVENRRIVREPYASIFRK